MAVPAAGCFLPSSARSTICSPRLLRNRRRNRVIGTGMPWGRQAPTPCTLCTAHKASPPSGASVSRVTFYTEAPTSEKVLKEAASPAGPVPVPRDLGDAPWGLTLHRPLQPPPPCPELSTWQPHSQRPAVAFLSARCGWPWLRFSYPRPFPAGDRLSLPADQECGVDGTPRPNSSPLGNSGGPCPSPRPPAGSDGKQGRSSHAPSRNPRTSFGKYFLHN